MKKKGASKTEKQGEITVKSRFDTLAGSAQLRESVQTYVEMKTMRAQLEILHGILENAIKNPGKSNIFLSIKGDVNLLAALNRVNNVNTVECQTLTRKIQDLLMEQLKSENFVSQLKDERKDTE